MKNACQGRAIILCALIVVCSIKNSALSSEQTKGYYQMQSTRQMTVSDSNDPPGYTIITTSEIKRTSIKLADFVAHKQSLGFDVQVVTEADFGGGMGDEAAENIRAWLQSHYVSDNIEYVLLIGDPRPDIGEIPMKMLWPRSHDAKYRDAPSDFYYADLTGNWNLDGDEFYGEWPDDFGPGGVDRQWQVMVGRIPCYKGENARFPYGDSVQDVDKILHQTIDYEERTQSGLSTDWRKNALLAMTLGDGACRLGEAICNDILIPAGWSYHRIYQDDYVDANCCGSLDPPPETTPCTPNDVCNTWRHGRFGLSVWWGHSGTTIKGSCDPNEQYPSFTFQVACNEGYPEDPNKLAYVLLKNGVVCTVAATREAWAGNPEPFAGSTTASSMAYEYVSRLVVGLTAGQALYSTKQNLPQHIIIDSRQWVNFLVFNIYGDPALRIVSPEGRIVYVDVAAAGAHDGSRWPDAYNHLQDALAIALPGDEIRVAQGTYRPDQDSAHPNGTGDATATFKLKNGVVIKGGYAGLGAEDPNARDARLFETVLSGEIGTPDVNDNSYHVVFAPTGTCEVTVLDALTITGGHARESDPNGGGMYVDKSYPTVIDCTFTRNYATGQGGGVRNAGGTVPLFTGCTFVSNKAYRGGGMANKDYSSPTLNNCLFSENQAQSTGGGMHNNYFCSPFLTNCTFVSNKAHNGGGMYSLYSNPKLANCIINNNSAAYCGGGLHNKGSGMILANCIVSGNSAYCGAGIGNNSSEPYLSNCTFHANRASIGGGLFNGYTTAILTNCIMRGDQPDEICDYLDADTLVAYSNVQAGQPGEGEGNVDVDPRFAAPGYWDLNGTPQDASDDCWIDGDYRLKSQAGRWDPVFLTWVQDDVTSPCIDAGDTNSPIGAEPEPNGGRINMGAYGGTAEASKSVN